VPVNKQPEGVSCYVRLVAMEGSVSLFGESLARAADAAALEADNNMKHNNSQLASPELVPDVRVDTASLSGEGCLPDLARLCVLCKILPQ
jgi:hypothetical protein